MSKDNKKELSIKEQKQVNKELINLNKEFFLKDKDYIKRYNEIRKIHIAVLDDMVNYINSGKYPAQEYYNTIVNDLKRETKNIDITIDTEDYYGAKIFNELFIYKNHNKIPSLTEVYIEQKKFKDKDKIKMLYAMRDSVVGLFKIINYDHMSGYVTYQDVFTKKKYKIIDISMSSLGAMYENENLYVYNRIITYDKISYGTGIPCILRGSNKRLKEFLKHHKYNNCSNFSRCLILFDIFKEDGSINLK